MPRHPRATAFDLAELHRKRGGAGRILSRARRGIAAGISAANQNRQAASGKCLLSDAAEQNALEAGAPVGRHHDVQGDDTCAKLAWKRTA